MPQMIRSSKIADPFYLSPEWRALSRSVLAGHALCGYCWQARAVLVDHIETIRRRPDLSLMRSNLMPCCMACSNRLTAAFDLPHSPMKYTPDPMPDPRTGLPLDPLHPFNGYTGVQPSSKRQLLDILATLPRRRVGPLPPPRLTRKAERKAERQARINDWKPVC